MAGGHFVLSVTTSKILLCLTLSLTLIKARAEEAPPCVDYRNQNVANGVRFIPNKLEPCFSCTCEDGFPAACTNVQCRPPNCELYEKVEEECCKFNCITASNDPTYSGGNGTGLEDPMLPGHGLEHIDSANLPLRLVASTVTSFLILALLLFMVHRLRQRRMLIMLRRLNADRQDDDTVAYLPQLDNVDMGIEFPPYEDPPPPYTPPKPPYIPQGEAPPPYDSPDAGENNNDSTDWTIIAGGEGDRQSNGRLANGFAPVTSSVLAGANRESGTTRADGTGQGSIDRVRTRTQRRERSSSKARQSTGSPRTQNSNGELPISRRSSSIDPRPGVSGGESRVVNNEAVCDGSDELAVAAATLTKREDRNDNSGQVVIQLQTRNSNSPQTQEGNDVVEESGKAPPQAESFLPANVVLQFIKRSDSIEIRRGSNSPRNSFYHSTSTSDDSSNNTSMQSSMRDSPDSGQPLAAMLESTPDRSDVHFQHSNSSHGDIPARYQFNPDRVRDESSDNIKKVCSNFPLGWDSGLHTPKSFGSTSDKNNKAVNDNNPPFNKPLVASCVKLRNPYSRTSRRDTNPPASLELPSQRASCHCDSQLEQAEYCGIRRLSHTVTGPRLSYQGLFSDSSSSPNDPRPALLTSSLASQEDGSVRTTLTKSTGLTPETLNAAVRTSLAPRSDNSPSAIAGACHTQASVSNSPLSPGMRPVIRSGSVSSQVSMFSVCSETGERKRPVLSLPPNIPDSDVMNSVHSICPRTSAMQASQHVTCSKNSDIVSSHPTSSLCAFSGAPNSAVGTSSMIPVPTASREVPVVHSNQRTASGDVPVVHTNQRTVSRDVPVVHSNQRTASGDVPVVHTNLRTVSVDVPVVHTNLRTEEDTQSESQPAADTPSKANCGAVPKTRTLKNDNKSKHSPLKGQHSKGHNLESSRAQPQIAYRDVEELTLQNGTSQARPGEQGAPGAGHVLPRPSFKALPKASSKPEAQKSMPLKFKTHKKRRPHSTAGTLDQAVAQIGASGQNGLVSNDIDSCQALAERSFNPPRASQGAVMNGHEPQIKQYGFIDRPEVLDACKDNTVYPEEGDKIPNVAYFEKLQHRSISRDRRPSQEDQNSSGYSSKSTGNDKSGASSGDRSRSASRSRSRERGAHSRNMVPVHVDNRRWSEPPVSVNGLHNGLEHLCHHDTKPRSPRHRKKKRMQVENGTERASRHGQGEQNGAVGMGHVERNGHVFGERVNLLVDNAPSRLPVLNGFNHEIDAIADEPENVANNNVVLDTPSCSSTNGPATGHKRDDNVNNKLHRLSTGPVPVHIPNDNEKDDDIDLCR